MIKTLYSFSYNKSGAFIASSRLESCKELAGNSFRQKKQDFIFYHPNCENYLNTIQEYFKLLGFDKKVKIEDAQDQEFNVKKVIVVPVDNVVEFEIAAIIVKSIFNEGLDKVPVSLDNFTGKYFTPAVKSIFKNLPVFLENLTDEMISNCKYNFSGCYSHGGLVNWSSKGIFKNELTKRRL